MLRYYIEPSNELFELTVRCEDTSDWNHYYSQHTSEDRALAAAARHIGEYIKSRLRMVVYGLEHCSQALPFSTAKLCSLIGSMKDAQQRIYTCTNMEKIVDVLATLIDELDPARPIAGIRPPLYSLNVLLANLNGKRAASALSL